MEHERVSLKDRGVWINIFKGVRFMKRFLIVSLLITVLVSACRAAAPQGEGVQQDQVVTIYKLPT
jgi:hypothetical protein